eukprot:GFUD01007492.1.p1 GENE.GFUD01007492.1~~GFUD01007492.1.p1  ORF type:complete len:215 (+),score=29.58 GFUD01007492.1:78-722(+)
MADSQEDHYYTYFSSLESVEKPLEMETYYDNIEPENKSPQTETFGRQRNYKLVAIGAALGLILALIIGIPLGVLICRSGNGILKECPKECAKPWTTFSSSCYRLWEETLTWSEAELRCQEEGGHLVSIVSEEEDKFIKDNFFTNKNIWIGANDKVVEGLWTWSDGSAWKFADWQVGQPNSYEGDEDCGYLWASKDGKWADAPCSSRYEAFLCKA